jgi:hypothetical protein
MIGKYACTSATALGIRLSTDSFFPHGTLNSQAAGLELEIDLLIGEEDLGLDSDG